MKDKRKKERLNKPFFNLDDEVIFKAYDDEKEVDVKGTIYIVEDHGVYGDNNHVYYDILVKAEDNPFTQEERIFKKVIESRIKI